MVLCKTIEPFVARNGYTGVFNPFATRWIQPAFRVDSQGDIYSPELLETPVQLGSRDSTKCWNWWHVQVFPSYELVFDRNNPPALDNVGLYQLTDPANHSSILKIEIETITGPSRRRVWRMDLGAGVDITVPPCNKVVVRVLIPDPTSLPAALPAVFTETPRRFMTAVSASARPVLGPIAATRPTYSQLFFMAGLQAQALVPRVDSAKELEIFSDEAFGTSTAAYLTVHETPIVTGYTPPVVFTPAGGITLPATAFNTTRAIIPGNANAITYNWLGESDDAIINIVQILHF